MNDNEVTAIAQSDSDNPEWTEDAWNQLADMHKTRKKDIHIKVDEDIIQLLVRNVLS